MIKILTVFLFSTLSFADTTPWKMKTHGYLVDIQPTQPTSVAPGGAVTYTGDITFVDVDPSEQSDTSDDSLTIRQHMTKDNVILRAFFPDEMTEVTSQLQFQEGTNVLGFTFQTSALQASDLNRLTIQVVDRTQNFDRLIQSEAKVSLRVLAVQAAIDALARQTGGTAKDQQQRQKKIAALTKTLTHLNEVVAKIDAKIIASQAIIGVAQAPTQVGNVIAPSGYSMNLMGGFMFETTINPGVVIQDLSTTVHTKVTRLFAPSKPNTKEWDVAYFYKNQKINTQVFNTIDLGQVISFDYTAQTLEPQDATLFKTTVTRVTTAKKNNQKLWGYNNFDIPVAGDGVSPVWAASSSFDSQARYDQHLNTMSISVEDALGRIDLSTLKTFFQGTDTAGHNINVDISSYLTQTVYAGGAGLSLYGDIPSTSYNEGDYKLVFSVSDQAGNVALPNPKSVTFSIDRTPPQILTNLPTQSLTRDQMLGLEISVLDRSPTQTEVRLNGESTGLDSDTSISENLTLDEGTNLIEIVSTDAAGNTTTITRSDITLDNTPPMITQLTPAQGQIYQSLNIPVSGTTTESLLYAKANGQDLTLSQDLKSFTGIVVANSSGQFPLHLELSDLAGNIVSQDLSIQIIITVLNGGLLSVVPDIDGKHLLVRGANGATRPGDSVSASGSFFNSDSGTADVNGAFTLRLNTFTTAQVTATDSALGRSDSATVSWGSNGGTLLSGMVKDVGDPTTGASPQPIAGVTVSSSHGGDVVRTDANGMFTFTKPLIGDQTITIDGSTAIQPPDPAPKRIYGKTAIVVSVGLSQSNVLARPIYLVPTPNTTDVQVVDASQGGTITSSDAPGVVLDIPSNSTQFPNGSSQAPIYMRTIPAALTTIPVLDFATPTNVVALEPSGTKFSAPVTVSLPNDSHFPPGTEMVIFSMDSASGQWQIGGVAKVSTDGNKVVSKEGMGLLHFSLIYSAPLAPVVREVGAKDKNGADTFNGSLSAHLNLPSYKALGQSISPSLLYNSSWAKPTVVVSNLFDLPSQEANVSEVDVGVDRFYETLPVTHCAFLFFGCHSDTESYLREIPYKVETSARSIFQPASIYAQFFSDVIQSNKFPFTNSIPDRSVVSYAMDLKDPTTGKYLPSGVYSYQSHYEVKYQQHIVGTQKITQYYNTPNLLLPPPVQTVSLDKLIQIDKIYPQDLTGSIFLQNEATSSYGQGWRLGGVQRIPQTSSDRLMLQEADGTVSSYLANNTISTVYQALNGEDVQGASINQWPNAIIHDKPNSRFVKVDLSNPGSSGSYFSDTLISQGNIRGHDFFIADAGFAFAEACYYYTYNFTGNPAAAQMLMLPDQSVVGTDINQNFIFKLSSSGSPQIVSGNSQNPPTFSNDYQFVPITYPPESDNGEGTRISSYCNSNSISCNQTDFHVVNIQTLFFKHYPDHDPFQYLCDPQSPSDGWFAAAESNPLVSGNLTVGVNKPFGITTGQKPNSIVIADYGMNAVRMLDLGNNQSGLTPKNCESC